MAGLSDQIRPADEQLLVFRDGLRVGNARPKRLVGVREPVVDPAAPFAIAGGSCFPIAATVPPGASCDIQLEFAPGGASGGFAGQFQIISSAPSSPDSVTLRGSVNAIPIPALNPWALLLLAALML